MKVKKRLNHNTSKNSFLTTMIIGIILITTFVIISGKINVTGNAFFSYQCNDNKDNDGDGKCDYDGCKVGRGWNRITLPPDPDCSSSSDNDESSLPCSPSAEICDNKDNDCDGLVDESLSKQCGVSNIGECKYGSQTCSSGVWSVCQGSIAPINETCDGKDNDCDGVTDEGCNCINGQIKGCGSSVGECVSGNQTCNNGNWGACIGEIAPSIEICDGKDNDCNGLVDDGCTQQNSTNSSCTSIIKQLTSDPSEPGSPQMYKDKIVFVENNNYVSDIHLFDLYTNSVKVISSDLALQIDPVIYEDKIVWTDYRNEFTDIYLYDLSTNTEKRLTTNFGNKYPDIYKDQVVYGKYINGTSKIYIFNLSTNSEKEIISGTGPAMYEDKIVYTSNRNGNFDIYMFDLTNNIEKQITTNIYGQYSPDIYKDKIVWLDERDNAYTSGNNIMISTRHVYMFDLSTNTERRISLSSDYMTNPSIFEDKIIWQGNGIRFYDVSTNVEKKITGDTSKPYNPTMYGDKVVWTDLGDGNANLFMYNICS